MDILNVDLSMADIYMNSILVLAGIMLHFLKKCKIEKINILHYWKSNPSKSIQSIIGAVVGFVILIKMGETATLAYLSCGYMADSLLNRVGLQLDAGEDKKVANQ